MYSMEKDFSLKIEVKSGNLYQLSYLMFFHDESIKKDPLIWILSCFDHGNLVQIIEGIEEFLLRFVKLMHDEVVIGL